MTEAIITQVEHLASYAFVWGFILIFLFMTMESTVLPIPSEVVMIPAGFMAYREELTFRAFWPDMIAVIIIGTLGSVCGAWINYYVSAKLGRPFLYKYGKYFFLSEKSLQRAEEVFRQYGEMATFVCRLIPVLRHLISIPAGLAQMNRKSFTVYTAAGAGLWMAILAGIGAYLGHILGQKASYREIIYKGEELLHEHFLLIMIITFLLAGIYYVIHHKIMTKKISEAENA